MTGRRGCQPGPFRLLSGKLKLLETGFVFTRYHVAAKICFLSSFTSGSSCTPRPNSPPNSLSQADVSARGKGFCEALFLTEQSSLYFCSIIPCPQTPPTGEILETEQEAHLPPSVASNEQGGQVGLSFPRPFLGNVGRLA